MPRATPCLCIYIIRAKLPFIICIILDALAGIWVMMTDRKSTVQAVIMSRIDYCASWLVFQFALLAMLQNMITLLLHWHWLPVTYRLNVKIAMLFHKCIYGNTPEYLKGLIKVKSITRLNFRSDGENLPQDYSVRSKKTLGERAFKKAAPRIWNTLPKDIRKQDNYYIFKKQLKTYHFKLHTIFN